MMRLLLAGSLATLTAAGLAVIPTGVPTEEERGAARAIRPSQLSADARFLSRAEGAAGLHAARAYVAARFEGMGLEPATAGGAWEPFPDPAGGPLLARLPGRDPSLRGEPLLVVARGAGAHDVAVLLGVAEAFAALPAGPRRPVVFDALGDGREAAAPGTRSAVRLEVGGAAAGGPGATDDARRIFALGVRLANAPGTSDRPAGDEAADGPRTALAEPAR